ncbi:MAG: phosphotransferase family protein [Actinobacteria bacterium]|nr:phosphotransferase family protein [Actinomycetota bacterium]
MAGVASLEVVDTPEQAARQILPPLLVRRPVERALDAAGLGEGPIEAERIGEGHSNVTYLLRRGAERFVLRRPPRPPLPPSAHDVLREARLLEALEPTAARTPRVLLAHADEAALGVPFYVMEPVEGVVVGAHLAPAHDTEEERRRIGTELIDALAELHAVDWRAAGLEGFGRPEGYLERQLRRFSGLWQLTHTRELPLIEEVATRLARTLPASPPSTIVHGDYRLGNTIYSHAAPARLLAILDWELATIGDPLADVGYLTATYSEPGAPDAPLQLTPVTRATGFPSRAELVARYERASGRSVGNLPWYQALALWKSAIFLEGNYRRWLAGTTDDAWYATLDVRVPALAEAAHELVRQAA